MKLDNAQYALHSDAMRLTLSLPDSLARRFFATVPSRQRSAVVARLIEEEVRRNQQRLEDACLAANADTELEAEIVEWQAFDNGPRVSEAR